MRIMRLRHRRQAAEAEEGCLSAVAEDLALAEVAAEAGSFCVRIAPKARALRFLPQRTR